MDDSRDFRRSSTATWSPTSTSTRGPSTASSTVSSGINTPGSVIQATDHQLLRFHAAKADDLTIATLASPELSQAQLLGMFIGAMSPRGKRLAGGYRQTVNWLEFMAEQPSERLPSPLTYALRALTVSHAGRMQHSKSLVESSRQLYGLALSQLAVVFKTSPETEALSSSTLSATMLLSYYEMFHSTDTNAWVRHAGGAGALIRARGPALAAATEFDRVMFMAYRSALIVQAFEAGATCFLDEPAWVNVSRKIWRDYSDGTDFHHAVEAFVEQLARLPRAVKAARDFPSVADQAKDPGLGSKRAELRRHIAQHRSRLRELYARMAMLLKRDGQEATTVAAQDPKEVLFPNQLKYPSVSVASLHCTYYICLTMLNVTLIELIRSETMATALTSRGDVQAWGDHPRSNQERSVALFKPPPPLEIEPTPDLCNYSSGQPEDSTYVPDLSLLRAENIHNAVMICRSVDCMALSLFHGPFFITFGLRISLMAFPGELERTWVKRQLQRIGQNFGMANDQNSGDASEGFQPGYVRMPHPPPSPPQAQELPG